MRPPDLRLPPRRCLRCFAIEAAEEVGVPLAIILGDCRKRHIAYARFRVWEKAYEQGWSTTKIAQFFGDRDHTTVIHGLRRAKELGLRDRKPRPPAAAQPPLSTAALPALVAPIVREMEDQINKLAARIVDRDIVIGRPPIEKAEIVAQRQADIRRRHFEAELWEALYR
jgi:hypothetical protein